MNTEIGHTPGPWKHDKSRDTIHSEHPNFKFSLICKIASGENREEEDANARLITSAPDLLSALETIYHEMGHRISAASFEEFSGQAKDKVVAAISKAKGCK